MQFERLVVLPGAWTCASGRFGVHLFQGELTLTDMDQLDAVALEWQRGPKAGKRVELVIVLPSGARMTSGERSRMTQIMRRGENDRVASATVILADGLRGAMQRSVLTGLMMLAPPPHPAKVFGTIAEAVEYLLPYLRQLPGAPIAQSPLPAVLALYESFRESCRGR
jgi:hypothetical protein